MQSMHTKYILLDFLLSVFCLHHCFVLWMFSKWQKTLYLLILLPNVIQQYTFKKSQLKRAFQSEARNKVSANLHLALLRNGTEDRSR